MYGRPWLTSCCPWLLPTACCSVAGCLRTAVAYDGVCREAQQGGSGGSGTTVAPGTPVTPPPTTPEPIRPTVGPTGPAGPAAGPCNCPRDYRPVCGSDMTTYNNACLAGCAGVPFLSGPCPTFGGIGGAAAADDDEEDDPRGSSQDPIVSSCPCPRLFLPVCGIDGRRYASACHARCYGVIAVRSALLRGCR